MKVLGICSFAGLGGNEQSFAGLLTHLPAEVERKAIVIGSGPLTGRLAKRSISAVETPRFANRPRPGDLLAFTRMLGGRIRRERPDVIWAAGQKAALLAAPAARLWRVPLVWHKVDFSWDRALGRPLALAASGITAVSEAVIEPVGGLGRRRLLGVVAPPVDPALEIRSPRPAPDRPTIGTLGRLVPYKGHHRVLEAAALLHAEFPRLRVLIAGGPVPEYPDYPARLRGIAAKLNLDDQVEMLGFVDDVSTVLARLNVLVNATYRDREGYGLEGRGRAIIEASWCGLPVVASRAGGAQESVLDGETGTLVEDSTPPELADAIRPYLRDPLLARRAGERGCEFARERFAAAPLGVELYRCLARVGR